MEIDNENNVLLSKIVRIMARKNKSLHDARKVGAYPNKQMFPPDMIKFQYKPNQSKMLDEQGQQIQQPSSREEKESIKMTGPKYYSTNDHRVYTRDPSNEQINHNNGITSS